MAKNARDAVMAAVNQALTAGADTNGHPRLSGYGGPRPFSSVDWKAVGDELTALSARLHLARDAQAARETIKNLIREYKVELAALWRHDDLDALKLPGLFDDAGIKTLPDPASERRFARQADSADMGVTAVDALVLESATLAVIAGPGRERSSSLLPPVHVAVVTPKTTILPDIPSLGPWWASLADSEGLMPSAVHCITGPSSTADIELIPVKGVHGPVRLEVVAVTGPMRP